MKKEAVRRQYAALPYRRTEDGSIEVLLITTRGTRRWMIPKGWPIQRRKPAQSAAQEAKEESGVVGSVGKDPVGSFRYLKQLDGGVAIKCEAKVFLLEVEKQLDDWPEKEQRQTQWFSVEAAANAVDEPELGAIIHDLPKFVRGGAPWNQRGPV